MSLVHAFSCIRTFKFLYFLYCILLVLFWLSLSLSLSLFLTLVVSSHLNVNPFHPRTLFVLGHLPLLLLLTPLHLTYDSVMRRPNRTSWRTFHDTAFIRNAKSFCQTFLTLTYPLSSTIGVGSHYAVSRSYALPWSYKSSTPICTDLITLYPSLSLDLGIRMVVTSGIVSKVLHIPRVAHLNYPGCKRLRTVSKDELSSLFCETPSSWGDNQNTSCSAFAKGPRILNMVMTFVLQDRKSVV